MNEASKTVLFLAVVMSFVLILAWLPVFLYQNIAEWYQSGITRLFSSVCHQQPDRMFDVGGTHAAICSRCTGIYAGWAAGLWGAVIGLKREVALPRKYVMMIIVGITVIIGVDIVAQWIAFWEGSNMQRAVLGLLWGAAIISILLTRNN